MDTTDPQRSAGILMTSWALTLIVTALLLVEGCRTDERRLREIVREELTASSMRSVMTDAHTVGPYSPAQRVGNFLFISGQIALDQETGTLRTADIETETRQALSNLIAILNKCCYDSSDVISTTIYLKDISDYAKMNMIYGGYFPEGNYPARVTVQVAGLPRDARIEISAIAWKTQPTNTE